MRWRKRMYMASNRMRKPAGQIWIGRDLWPALKMDFAAPALPQQGRKYVCSRYNPFVSGQSSKRGFFVCFIFVD